MAHTASKAVADQAVGNPMSSSLGMSILPAGLRGTSMVIAARRDAASMRRDLRSTCPTQPGVYGWLDRNGQLLYVGKSKSLRHRLLTYWGCNPVDPKTIRIRRQAHQLIWESSSHELAALLREQELIHRHRPSFNVLGQPHRRLPGWVCIGGGPTPTAFAARRMTPRASQVFGPIWGTRGLKAAVENLNHTFRLRDCPDRTPMRFTTQRELFAVDRRARCMRLELGSCVGPCAAACSQAAYHELVDHAVDFLEGRNLRVLTELSTMMAQAAAQRRYELAGIFRDRLESLSWLARRLETSRRIKQSLNGAVGIPAFRTRTVWMAFRSGDFVGWQTGSQRAEPPVTPPRILSDAPEMLLVHWQAILATWRKKNPDGGGVRFPGLTPKSSPAGPVQTTVLKRTA